MIVTEVDYDIAARLQSQSDEQELTRTPGLHLSDIYKDMRDTIAPRDPIDERDLAFYGAGGFLWERVWSEAHRDAVISGDLIRPGEIERDGVIGSPDAWDLANSRLVELKCRWMSASKFDHLEKHFYYEILQCQGYLAMMMDGLGWTEVEFSVFFLNGDYRPPLPQARTKILKFTEEEIEDAWRVLIGHAGRRGWL